MAILPGARPLDAPHKTWRDAEWPDGSVVLENIFVEGYCCDSPQTAMEPSRVETIEAIGNFMQILKIMKNFEKLRITISKVGC